MPSLGTIQRVLRQVNPQELAQVLSEWTATLLNDQPQEPWAGLAVDGKTLRGSGEQGQASWQVLSAFSHHLEAVLV